MVQPSPSSPLQWDGKCQNCRKLMSGCMCFRQSEGDAGPLMTTATQESTDASETRPLWNALRKMHRKSPTARLALMQPPANSSREHRKHSEALPPLRAPSTSTTRRHTHRRSDARPPQNPRRASREPRREPSPERHSATRKDRLQRAGFTSSSHDLKRDVNKDSGVMRSVQSTNSIDKHRTVSISRPIEKFSDEPQANGEDEENQDDDEYNKVLQESMAEMRRLYSDQRPS